MSTPTGEVTLPEPGVPLNPTAVFDQPLGCACWITDAPKVVDAENTGRKFAVPLPPIGPAGPVAPCGPVIPCGPVAPCGPLAPCAPFAPGVPAGPMAPAAPCGPVGPAGPAGPTIAAPVPSCPLDVT